MTALEALSAGDEIAYIFPSVEEIEIRVIDQDGQGDRNLFSVPEATTSVGNRLGDKLSWHPDGNELAFDSAHDSSRSLYLRDIYAISASGDGLRRISIPPGPSEYARFPKGAVTVDIDTNVGGRQYSVFVDGASASVEFTAASGSNTRVTFPDVADFGAGVRQFVRLFVFNPSPGQAPCHFDVAVFADVLPGQTVHAGKMPTFLNDGTCPFAFNPTWHADGDQVMFMARPYTTSLSFNEDVRLSPSRPAAGSADSEQRLVLDDTSTFDDWYRVYMSPSPALSDKDDMLILENRPTKDGILFAEDYTNAIDIGGLAVPCSEFSCEIMDVAWLADGTNILLSNYEEPAASGTRKGVIYERIGADYKPLLTLPNEVIGTLSVSQDGSTIAFTRASRVHDQFTRQRGPRALCPCDIWLVDRDGSNLRLLKRDARAPAFRPASGASGGDGEVFSSVLPSSRSVAVGAGATFFATIVNAGSTQAQECTISPSTSVPADFFYQETDPTTNALVGTANTPVNIAAGGFQTMLFSFTPTRAFASREVSLVFDCANTQRAPVITGLNTVVLAASETPTPDVVALAATVSGDGVVKASPSGVFSVASVNVGAQGLIEVRADTGSAALPVSIALCETDTATGACINPAVPSINPVTVDILSGETPTFGIFVASSGPIPFDPSTNRVFVRFSDAAGETRGSTSVAVTSP